MGKLVYTHYGNSTLLRVYCPSCRGMSIVLGGITVCCDSPIDKNGEIVSKIEVSARKRRTQLSQIEKKVILNNQKYACYYCGIDLVSGAYYRKYKIIRVKINYDHIIPFSFGHNNHAGNYAASCHVCNAIKSNKIFKNLDEAKDYIEQIRRKKGYEVA